MIILKNALLFSFSKQNDFGRYSVLISQNRIQQIVKSKESGSHNDRVNSWIGKYGPSAEVVDCTHKIVMPPFINSCQRSEGTLIHYLLRKRHYERNDGDLYTDLIFNYVYQELQHEEITRDLTNIYNYSFLKSLKSGIAGFNEFSLRNDTNHLSHISSALKMTGQRALVSYPIKHDAGILQTYKTGSSLSPAYYLTDENRLTLYDLGGITELRKQNIDRLFLEVATNKEVTENFRQSYGKPILKYLDEFGLIDEKTYLINPLYLNYDEMKIIKDKGAGIIICPRDLLYFTSRYFPIDDFMNNGIKFAIGTGWLGEDLFKDLRVFRNKYREMNLSSVDLLKAITITPYKMFLGDAALDDEVYCTDADTKADLIFLDISDARFQFFPESNNFSHVCDFLIDNLTSPHISDVMLNGQFVIRNNKAVDIDEAQVLESAARTREHLYKVGRYEQLAERQSNRDKTKELETTVPDHDDIKLFTEAGKAADETEEREEFRIKSRIPSARRKAPSVQKNLFEETDSNSLRHAFEYLENPEFNLLNTEIDEVKDVDGDMIETDILDEKLFKTHIVEKKPEKLKANSPESKVELPKNVKLKFGDE